MNKQEIYISRFDNGQKGTETHYMNGKQHGKYTCWFESGQTEWEQDYAHGERHGRHVRWFKSGQKRAEAHYLNDELHGKWTWWLEDGTVEEVLWHDIDSGTHEQLTTESKFKDKYPEFYKEHYETGKE